MPLAIRLADDVPLGWLPGSLTTLWCTGCSW
jgi:hypothetical protein